MENAPCDKLGILRLHQLLYNLSYVRDSVYSIPIVRTKKVQYILISDLGSVQTTLQQSIWVDVLHRVLKETKHPRVKEVLMGPEVGAETFASVLYEELEKGKKE